MRKNIIDDGISVFFADVLHFGEVRGSSPAGGLCGPFGRRSVSLFHPDMYRLLEAHQEVKERKGSTSPSVYQKPELLATAPNQVWSWDITKLLGPGEMDLFLSLCRSGHLQPLRRGLDDCSRSLRLGQKLIPDTLEKQNIPSGATDDPC